MGAITRISCILLLVFVSLEVSGKPLFDEIWCDFFCDDDDINASTSASNDDYFDCADCRPRRRRNRTTTLRPGMPQSISMVLPSLPAGMNFTMTNNNGNWQFNMSPSGPSGPGGPGPGGNSAPPQATTTQAPTTSASTTAAGSTTGGTGTTGTGTTGTTTGTTAK